MNFSISEPPHHIPCLLTSRLSAYTQPLCDCRRTSLASFCNIVCTYFAPTLLLLLQPYKLGPIPVETQKIFFPCMSPDYIFQAHAKSKSTLHLDTKAATACGGPIDELTAVVLGQFRKGSDTTLQGDDDKLLVSLPPLGETPDSPLREPASPTSVSSTDTQVPALSSLDAFHESLQKTESGIFLIRSPDELKTLLDFFYGGSNALAPSTTTFPYLHGMSQIKQRVYFHEKFNAAEDLDLLNNMPEDIPEVFPHDLSIEKPQIPFNLMTVHSTETDSPRLVNTIKLGDIMTFKDEDSMDYEFSLLHKLDDFYQLENPPSETQELLNRNYHLQSRLMAPMSHFLVYNNQMSSSANFHVAKVISSIKLEDQNVYVVEFPANEWSACSPYLEKEVTYSIGGHSSVFYHEPYQKKLQVMEQQLIWQLNGIKELFPRFYIGNVFNFKHLVASREQNFKLHIHCHENAKLPSLEALRQISQSLQDGRSHETYFLEFPDSIAKHTDELSPKEIISYVNVLKLIHNIVLKRKGKMFVYSFDGFTCLSLLVLSLSMLWTSDSVEEAALNIFRKPAFKLYLYREDFTFLKQFEPYILWLRQNGLKNSHLQLSLPVKDILQIPRKKPSPIDWFEEGKDMNFPAYIHDTLFLGSAAHSSSITVLATLGINRLISIDKLPVWFHLLGCKFKHEAGPFDKNVIKPIFLFNDDKAKVYEVDVPERVRDLLQFQVRSIVYIYNVRDDGKDLMLPLLLECPDHVQRKLLVDPDDKSSRTLLHCRVGVSRSASLAIAAIMKYFHMDVLESYLYVRVRRFNVVIQPNLRLFYELFLFDEMLQRKNNPDYRRKHCWWVVCDQIARLNQSYIR